MPLADWTQNGCSRQAQRSWPASLWRAAVVVLPTVFLPFWPGSARAAELAYRAPAACPSRDDFTFRVERALERPLSDLPGVTFDVSVQAGGAGYAATLRLVAPSLGPERERQLAAPDCSKLVDALTVAVVLAVGALEGRQPGTGEDGEPDPLRTPDVAPSTPSETDPLAEEIPADAAPTEAAIPARPAIVLLVLGDAGTLPSPALGIALGAGLGFGPWRLQATAGALAEQHVDLASSLSPAPGADLNLFFGAFAGCRSAATSGDGRLALSFCAGVELGQMSGRGTQVRDPQTKNALWISLSGGLDARWMLSQGLYANAQLNACFPVNHDEFVLGALGRVHRPSNVVGRGALGLGWEWQ